MASDQVDFKEVLSKNVFRTAEQQRLEFQVEGDKIVGGIFHNVNERAPCAIKRGTIEGNTARFSLDGGWDFVLERQSGDRMRMTVKKNGEEVNALVVVKEPMVVKAEDAARVERMFFVGQWVIGRDASDRSNTITLRDDSTAIRLRNGMGTWEVVNGEAHITWPNGWRNILRCERGGVRSYTLHAGATFDNPPGPGVPAMKSSTSSGGGSVYKTSTQERMKSLYRRAKP